MSLRHLLLPALAVLVIPFGSMAQQTPAPPAQPQPPAGFSFRFDGGGSFLGIYPEEVNSENMNRYGLREVRGVAVAKVVEDSPAARAGLKQGDVILRLNGEEVTSARKLSRLINEVAPDHTARLTISRGGAEQELSVTIGKREGEFNPRVFENMPELNDGEMGKRLEELNIPRGNYAFTIGQHRLIGVSAALLTKQLADYFGVAQGKGVLLTDVRDESPAARAGLKAGDVVTAVDGEAIANQAELSRAINRKTEGDITLTIIRNRSQLNINVTPEKGASFFNQEFPDGATPRIVTLNVPRLLVAPQGLKGALPSIRVAPDAPSRQVLPRLRSLIAPRPL